MKNQKGVTITGMLLVSVALVVVLLVGFKVVPFYLEYNTIQKNFKAMAEDPALQKGSVTDMRRAWDARTSVDNVKSLGAQEIDYSRDASGWNISAEYAVKVPLFQNIAVCLDFHPTSAK